MPSSADSITTRIDHVLMAELPFRSTLSPILDLLREAGTTILALESELAQAKEQRALAQQILLEQSNRHDPRACTTRGWR